MGLSPSSSGKGGGGSNPSSISLAAQNLIAETIDRALISTTAANVSGSLAGGSMPLRAGQVVTNLLVGVQTAGVGMTHGSLALYDLAGNLLRSTADVPATFQTTGLKTIALTSTYTQSADGLVYAACFLTTGTSMPSLFACPTSSTTMEGQIAGGAFRTVFQSGLATQPNPATFGAASPLVWVGAT
jgi:hypothetical protein